MSIATKTGDQGQTGLMYNRRIAKNAPRVEAYGTVDELNASLGMARATATHPFIADHLREIQPDLVVLMGELATLPEDLPTYARDGYGTVTPAMTAKLNELIKSIESQKISFRGWATPGDTLNSAALDMARTVCRRAERHVCALSDCGQLPNPETIVYLNRLSDALWLMARWVETQAAGNKPPQTA